MQLAQVLSNCVLVACFLGGTGVLCWTELKESLVASVHSWLSALGRSVLLPSLNV